MAERTVIEYKPGDLVRWYERYADGFMTKDIGDGVIIRKRDFNVAWADSLYANYSVYRTKYSDTMIFEEVELEYLSIDTPPIEMITTTIGAPTDD